MKHNLELVQAALNRLVRDGHFVGEDYEDDDFISYGEVLDYFQNNNMPEREDESD